MRNKEPDQLKNPLDNAVSERGKQRKGDGERKKRKEKEGKGKKEEGKKERRREKTNVPQQRQGHTHRTESCAPPMLAVKYSK